jgi:hypothetical protein
MQPPGLKDPQRSGKTPSVQRKSLDSTAGGDAEFCLDVAAAHTVGAVMEVGDDAGVVEDVSRGEEVPEGGSPRERATLGGIASSFFQSG